MDEQVERHGIGSGYGTFFLAVAVRFTAFAVPIVGAIVQLVFLALRAGGWVEWSLLVVLSPALMVMALHYLYLILMWHILERT